MTLALPAAWEQARNLSDAQLARELMAGLYEQGLFRTWYRHQPKGWTLISGSWSPVYLQLRELCGHPRLLAIAGEALGRLIRRDIPDADCLVGVAFAGIPLAVAVSLATGIPAAMTRKIAGRDEQATAQALECYGQHAAVEGALASGTRLVLIDDLVTGFDSKLSAAQQVIHEVQRRNLHDVDCSDVAVLIDRQQGGAAAATARGFALHSLIALPTDGLEWLEHRLAPIELETLRAYFADPQPFQEPGEQARLLALAAPGRA